MTTALCQLVLKRVLAATEEQQNNELYPSINIGVGIVKGDMGQPNILVSLDTHIFRGNKFESSTYAFATM